MASNAQPLNSAHANALNAASAASGYVPPYADPAEEARRVRSEAAARSWKPTPARVEAFERNLLRYPRRGARGNVHDAGDPPNFHERDIAGGSGVNKDRQDMLYNRMERFLAEQEERREREEEERQAHQQRVRELERERQLSRRIETMVPQLVSRSLWDALYPGEPWPGAGADVARSGGGVGRMGGGEDPYSPHMPPPTATDRARLRASEARFEEPSGPVPVEAPEPVEVDSEAKRIEDHILGRRR